jgi:HrpA-like RNA helicase
LENFSHVVLDEVHERFVEADFLMALLRMLLSRPESLRTRIVVTLGPVQ